MLSRIRTFQILNPLENLLLLENLLALSFVRDHSFGIIWKKFLSRISDPDRGRDHDHGSDDVIVIEDFLFRELLLRGRCLAPQPTRRCTAFPFMNSVFLLRWELFDLEWEVKASRNGVHKRNPVRAYQGQFDFIAIRYRPIVKVYICKWDIEKEKESSFQRV